MEELKPKITAPQERALKQLVESGGWKCAYDLKVGLNSLDGLKAKGLVNYKFGAGSLSFPRTGIMWIATPEAISFWETRAEDK